MGFQGNLKSLSFPDLLQLLTMGKKTGTLRVTHGERIKEIYFKEGHIIYATSTCPDDMIENILLKKGKITRDELAKAKQVQEITGKGLPQTLVYLNILSKEDVAEQVRAQIEEIVFSLFSWEDGEFTFEDNKLPDTEYMVTALNTMNILMEGTRRIDEWARIRKNLPPDNTVLKVSPMVFSQRDEIRLTPDEVQVLSLVDGERSIEEIKEKSPTGELATAKAIYSLLMSGYIQKVGLKEARTKRKAEEKEILEITVKLYSNAFNAIKKVLSEKIGKSAGRVVRKSFEEVKKRYPIVGNINLDSEGNFDFANFAELVRKLPEGSRMHEVSVGLAQLFEDLLSLSYSLLGSKVKDQIVQTIKTETETLINENLESLKNSGVYSDFMRLLKL